MRWQLIVGQQPIVKELTKRQLLPYSEHSSMREAQYFGFAFTYRFPWYWGSGPVEAGLRAKD
jgi:hypothetical protein